MHRTKTTIAAAAALTVGLSLAGCSTASHPGAHASTSTSATASVHNDQDVMFAQGMLPHHEQAIEMSDMLLKKGTGVRADVVTLAKQITAEQRPEITELRSWLTSWGVGTSMSGMDHSMSGMMSDSDMTALDTASADDAGKLFLQQMVEHHTSAVDMAKTEVATGENPDAVAMAKSIVSSQTEQITRMEDLLASR